MNFYKIGFADGQFTFVFKCETEFKENSLIINYALKANILPANFYFEELKAEKITESDYANHLIREIVMLLKREIGIKVADIKHKKDEEVLSECGNIVVLNDVCYALEDADAEKDFFDYEKLESWLELADKMPEKLIERIINCDHSRENEAIMDLISAGWEE